MNVLTTLELRNFAIVDEVRLELGPGLNVLTGETGAGKSILVDALGLLAGARPDTGYIRTGEASALVQATFTGAAITTAARRLAANGRHTARLDGEVVTVAELTEAGSSLLAIFGQHAGQLLADTHAHQSQLDRLLPATAQRTQARYRAALHEHQRTGRRIAELRGAERDRARQLDILGFQIDEIDEARIDPGADAEIAQRLTAQRNAERLAQGAAQATALLSEGEGTVLDLLAEAQRALDGAARFHATPAALAAELREVAVSAQAVSAELVAFLDAFEADSAELERLEARQATLEGLKRKYGDGLEAVLAYRDAAAAERATLAGADAELDAAERRLEALEAQLVELGTSLSAARKRGAKRLGRGVLDHLAKLGMPNASFEVGLVPHRGFGPYGLERVTFLFSANLGEPPTTLQSVASGGELSRVMLALNLVTGSSLPTLVFDEIDAGIGGKTARSVGALLRRLSAAHQVLVVTHLPQVAAYADTQFTVHKLEQGGRTTTRVERLDPEERERELARMLSGAVTEASRLNARELLAEAGVGTSAA